MKAIVHTQYPILKGLFDKGDKVEIEIIRHTEDIWGTEKVYAKAITTGTTQAPSKIVKVLLAEKGSMKSWHVKSKNGHYYDESCFHSFIGYKSLGEIFKRVN